MKRLILVLLLMFATSVYAADVRLDSFTNVTPSATDEYVVETSNGTRNILQSVLDTYYATLFALAGHDHEGVYLADDALSADEIAAINGASTPSASNVFVVNEQITAENLTGYLDEYFGSATWRTISESNATYTQNFLYGYDRTAHDAYDPEAAIDGGNVYYVSVTGSDSAAGSLAAPWRTITYALAQTSPGDTVFMRGGTHAKFSAGSSASGSSGSPVTLCSYPGEWAVIDGGGSSSNTIYFNGVDYLNLESFELTGTGNATATKAALFIQGSSNVLVKNVYSHHNIGNGFETYGTNDSVTFENCTANYNYDILYAGENTDGFKTGGSDAADNTNISYVRCLAAYNADDGFDFWASQTVTLEDSVAAYNGKNPMPGQQEGNGNGFKWGGQTTTEGAGQITGTRLISYNNLRRGFTDNATQNNVDMINCTGAYNGLVNFDNNDSVRTFNIINSVSVGGSDVLTGTNVNVTTSLGGGFGGTVVDADFLSVDYTDLGEGTFFYPADATLLGQGNGDPYSDNIGTDPDTATVVNETEIVSPEIDPVFTQWFKSFAGTYTGGSAYLCVNDAGTIFVSESACP